MASSAPDHLRTPGLISNRPCYEGIKVVVDVNVGRLAKWLRIMGYDTLLPTHAEDNELVRIALRGGRIIVTRDAGMAVRHAVTTGRLRVVLIKSDDLKSQVIGTLQLGAVRQFSRCIRCNQPLEGIPRDLTADRVPPYVSTHKQSS